MTSTAKRIIVVGGGIGGTMTANNLVAKLYPEILNVKVASDTIMSILLFQQAVFPRQNALKA